MKHTNKLELANDEYLITANHNKELAKNISVFYGKIQITPQIIGVIVKGDFK